MTIPKLNVAASQETKATKETKETAAEVKKQEKNNSIWVEDDGNGTVDKEDIKCNTDDITTLNAISNFVAKNLGKSWSSVQHEWKMIVASFNTRMSMLSFANSLHGTLDTDPQAAMEDFAKQAQSEYDAFKNQGVEEYNATKAKNEQEMAEFTEDANGAVMNFTSQAVKEKATFVKESVNKILESLKNGADGGVILEGLGTIKYDKEKQAVVYNKIGESEPQVLDDASLASVLDDAISQGVAISGKSQKITYG